MAIEKGDEMDCLVRGCNFLQTAVPREAFTFRNGKPSYIDKGEAPCHLHSPAHAESAASWQAIAASACMYLLQCCCPATIALHTVLIALPVCTAANGDTFPYLLVNIGSGVSLLKVRNEFL